MAVNRSFGRKWGASAIQLNSTHRDYWMCHNCGHKFRNLDSLEDELALCKKGVKSSIYAVILMAVLSIMVADLLVWVILIDHGDYVKENMRLILKHITPI